LGQEDEETEEQQAQNAGFSLHFFDFSYDMYIERTSVRTTKICVSEKDKETSQNLNHIIAKNHLFALRTKIKVGIVVFIPSELLPLNTRLCCIFVPGT
jgi:hypothetical protein